MSKTSYIDMIIQLRERTEGRKAIWKKGSRDDEFKINFKSGSLVIDKGYDQNEDVTTYDFQIYNKNGDQIYNSGPVSTYDEELYPPLETLHDSAVRCYYRVDETIKGFTEELEDDGIIGEENSESSSSSSSRSSSSSIPDEDIPF